MMKKKGDGSRLFGYLILSSVLQLLLLLDLKAQTVSSVKNYDETTGLPSREVSNVVEDSKGFIWATTAGGLVRFDGGAFKIWTAEEGYRSSSFCAPVEDPNSGNILLGTDFGLCGVANEKMTPIDIDAFTNGKTTIYNIFFDDNKRLWVGCEDFVLKGRWVREKKNYSFVRYEISGPCFSMAEYDGLLYAGTPQGLFCLKNGKWTQIYRNKSDDQKIGIVWNLFPGNDGYLYFNDNCLRRYRSGKLELVQQLNASTSLLPVWRDAQTLAYGFDSLQIEQSGSQKVIFAPKTSVFNRLNRIIRAKDGSFWIAHGDGLAQVRILSGAIAYTYPPGTKVHSVSFANGILWAGTKDNRLLQVHNDGRLSEAQIIQKIEKRHNEKIRDWINLVQFDDPNYFLLTAGNQVLLYNPKNDSMRRVPERSRYSYFRSFLKDRKSRIFLGGVGIVLCYEGGSYRTIDDKNRLGLAIVTSIAEDEGGRVWIGTSNGLFKLSGDSLERINSISEGTEVQQLLIERTSKRLLIATGGQGVLVVNTRDGSIERKMSIADGLPSKEVLGLHQDLDNRIWIFTTEGLLYYFPAEQDITFIYPKLNSRIRAHKWVSMRMTAFGDNIWLNTSDDILKIDCKVAAGESAPYKPHLYIAKGTIENFGAVSGTEEELKLNYRQNGLEIQFGTIQDPLDPAPIYEYYLVGLDKEEFSRTNQSGNVVYTSIPAGSYVLKVRVRNAASDSKIFSYSFTIAPPWYLSKWMYLLYIASGIALIWYVVSWRYRIRERKATEKRILLEAELRAIRAQLNPHFIQNLFASVASSFHQVGTDEASKMLHQISAFFRKVLYNTEKTVHSLEDELAFSEQYLQLMQRVSPTPFTYAIDIPDAIDTFDILVPGMILQPLIENAIKYGATNVSGDNRIIIEVRADGNRLVTVVADSGFGFRGQEVAEKAKTSRGWQITQQRIKLFSKDKSFEGSIRLLENGPLSGGNVELVLPIL